MNKFMCTSVPGLEEILWKEIEKKITDAKLIDLRRGKVLFSSDIDNGNLMQLECADNIYFFIEKFKIGPHKVDLDDFSQKMKTLNFKEAIKFMGEIKNLRILVSASKKGKQTYSRFDVADRATKALTSTRQFKEGTIENHNFPIRIDVNETECMVSVQLTSASFKFRGSNYGYMPGGIRPTIASALIFLSDPSPKDVFYDPFCGSGTIPRERARSKARRILASDYDPVAVDNTKNNVPDSVKVFCCDATEMKAADNSIDVIVSNIPYGKQVVVEDIYKLYVDFLKDAKRVLSSEGRMILLTSRDEIIEAANINNFSIKSLYTISLHGLLVTVYSLKPML